MAFTCVGSQHGGKSPSSPKGGAEGWEVPDPAAGSGTSPKTGPLKAELSLPGPLELSLSSGTLPHRGAHPKLKEKTTDRESGGGRPCEPRRRERPAAGAPRGEIGRPEAQNVQWVGDKAPG